ncbi:anaphase-promoting complex subunit 10 [Histoplasma capsulatum var. duboisii H88]|uniref:Anaphase-promoting complex subunit 10 n=2 Tax=Ajellomyces capsulatus TaxID=5037 RepID=F0UFR6_AJEC8|nr:anaphase-promoting complex subunit 10 [Histoplasma capsulatum var. duboisii H88]QSS54952.1 anaphase-promoting complex subunit 10 [Histoplasma capsulatum var. duboisii H88]
MPRHGLRRGVGGHSAFPSEDGASASTPSNDQPYRHPNFEPPVPARNPRAEIFPANDGHPRLHNLPIGGDPDLADTEEDLGESGEEHDDEDEDDIDIDIEDEEGEVEMEGQEYDDYDERHTAPPIPANLREISSLASWTVSTHKPGCGIAALRHPSPSQFWQSDGPQPHTLTLHFFKRVAIVRIRVYLDFELDESYTPTKMIFLAGMGGNDLVEFATWQGEAPTGWVDIDLQGAGGRHEKVGRRGSKSRQRRGSRRKGNLNGEKGEVGARSGAGTGASVSQGHEAHSDDEILDDGSNGNSSPKTDYEDGDGDGDDDDDDYDDITDMDPSSGNVLKAMVIQVRISENHQNGKDTHVRGFQVFARDGRRLARERHEGARKSLKPHGATGADAATDARNVRAGSSMPVDQGGGAAGDDEVFGPAFDEDDWMGEMEIR